MVADPLPEPLVPPEVDLTDFAYMPLDVRRLLKSETWIDAAYEHKLGHALMCLWAESWHQIPAASLPDNDRVLARFAMCSSEEWAGLKAKALKGWIKCSDGLLYHPVVAEKALVSWEGKRNQRGRTKAATAARQQQRIEAQQAKGFERDEQRDVDVTDNVTFTKGEGEGERKGEKEEKMAPSAPAEPTSSPLPDSPASKRQPSYQTHPAFPDFWAAYPSRGEATNPKKEASQKFDALMKRGVSTDEIIKGTIGYAAYCQRSGKFGTETVMQAKRFLKEEVWTQYLNQMSDNGTHGAVPLWKTDPAAWKDTRQPPP
jgi:uncharacterized protein DUF1376